MRRTVIVLVLLLIGVLALGQVEIEFWHAMRGGHLETLEAITAKFMEENPDIVVKLVGQGGYGDLNTKLIAAAAAMQPPTLAQFYADWVAAAYKDALMPLDGLIPQEVLDDIPEKLLQACYFDGKLLTVPFNKSTLILFYNTDLVPEPPTTWEELIDTAKALTVDEDGDGTPERYGFGLRPYAEMFTTPFWQAGGRFFSEDMTESLLYSEPGLKALEFLLELKATSLYQTGYLSGPFGSGKVAMYIGSVAGIPYVARAAEGKVNWSTAVLPKGPVNNDSIYMGTDIGIFTLNTTPEQREAALKYILYLLSPEAHMEWAKGTGYIPFRKSAITSEEWKAYMERHPERVAVTEQAFHGFTYPNHPQWYSIRNVIGDMLEAVLLGDMTPEEALQWADETIEEEYLK
ncbi:ABC transporter substrate-binding protein [Candidatus Acetothermia bacterium]|nr:MAG: ABC transporter substrate-binding protein [Candidatus Acetothermia bacterium]